MRRSLERWPRAARGEADPHALTLGAVSEAIT